MSPFLSLVNWLQVGGKLNQTACQDFQAEGQNRWQMCDASYRRHVAHTRSPAMNEYEIDGSMSDREEDHLILLQFGGELI